MIHPVLQLYLELNRPFEEENAEKQLKYTKIINFNDRKVVAKKLNTATYANLPSDQASSRNAIEMEVFAPKLSNNGGGYANLPPPRNNFSNPLYTSRSAPLRSKQLVRKSFNNLFSNDDNLAAPLGRSESLPSDENFEHETNSSPLVGFKSETSCHCTNKPALNLANEVRSGLSGSFFGEKLLITPPPSYETAIRFSSLQQLPREVESG